MKSCITLVGTLALLALAGPASADVVIDFGSGILGPGGTVAVSGGQATGTNIGVQTMIVTGTVGHDGTYILFGAGPSAGGSNGSALVNFNTATGVFSVVGGVCALGTGLGGTCVPLVASTTLATGTGSASISTISSTTLVFVQPDTKAASLLTALGLSPSLPFKLMSATFNYTGTASPFTVTSTDIQNVSVPEPTSILMLGTAMLGMTNLIRRRSRKA
jgi:hypothetical protein